MPTIKKKKKKKKKADKKEKKNKKSEKDKDIFIIKAGQIFACFQYI